MLLRTVS